MDEGKLLRFKQCAVYSQKLLRFVIDIKNEDWVYLWCRRSTGCVLKMFECELKRLVKSPTLKGEGVTKVAPFFFL